MYEQVVLTSSVRIRTLERFELGWWFILGMNFSWSDSWSLTVWHSPLAFWMYERVVLTSSIRVPTLERFGTGVVIHSEPSQDTHAAAPVSKSAAPPACLHQPWENRKHHGHHRKRCALTPTPKTELLNLLQNANRTLQGTLRRRREICWPWGTDLACAILSFSFSGQHVLCFSVASA